MTMEEPSLFSKDEFDGMQRHLLNELERIASKPILSDSDLRFYKQATRGGVHAYISFYDHDRERWDYYMHPAHSFDIGFFGILMGGMRGTVSTATYVDNGGTPRTIAGNDASTFQTIAGAGVTTAGIQIGTGNTATANTDSALAVLIANGNGAGQVNYGANATADATTSGTQSQVVETRGLTGNAIGSVAVAEMGLVGTVLSAASDRSFMMLRDLITVTIGLGAVKTATYTLIGVN